MSKIFKSAITPKLLHSLQSSLIGQNIENTTDLTIVDILKNCLLEVPEEYIPRLSWLMIWGPDVFTIKPEYLYQTQLLLKLAWFYNPENDFDSTLYGAVADELSKFEIEELNQLKQKELEIALETSQEFQKNLKKVNSQIKMKQNEIEKYQSQTEKIRRKNIDSAKKKRPKKDLDDWIEDELEEFPLISPKELWKKLPKRKDGPFYFEEEKIHFVSENYESIQYQAFCSHVKTAKKNNSA